MLIHSCIYYQLDDCVVSDEVWQRWANELRDLQNDNPDETTIGYHDEIFKGWDGTTGVHLPIRYPLIMYKANQLIERHNNA